MEEYVNNTNEAQNHFMTVIDKLRSENTRLRESITAAK